MKTNHTRPADVARLVLCLVCVVIFLPLSRAGTWVTLPVNLDDIRGEELVTLVRTSVLKEDHDRSQPLDISTLATLHEHYLKALRLPPWVKPPIEARYTTPAFEKVMRAELAKTDLTKLRELAFGDGQDDPGNSALVGAYCHLWITQKVAQIIAAKPKVVFPSRLVPVPANLSFPIRGEVDPTEFRRALSPFFKLFAAVSKQPPVPNPESDAKNVQELLRNPEAKVAEQFLHFGPDGFCGWGADEAQHSQAMLALMALLQEGRIAEAVGVSFMVLSEPAWMREPGRPFDAWRTDLLRYCGFDPETMYLSNGNIELLAALGSEKAAQEGIAALREKRPVPRWTLPDLVRFLRPGFPYDLDKEDPRRAISQKTQSEIFALMDTSLRESRFFRELQERLRIFADLARPETKPMVERLLTHPSTTIAQQAVETLRCMGESHDEIPPAPPVRFRYLLNGQPWKSTSLDYTIWDSTVKYSAHSGRVETDAEGFGEIPRDQFLDYQMRQPLLHFNQRPQPAEVTRSQVYDRGWLDSEDISVAAPFDQTIIVNFTAARFPIEITYDPPVSVTGKKSTAKITLYRSGQNVPDPWKFPLEYGEDTLPLPDQFAFGVLAPGTYRVGIIAAGFTDYYSAPVDVKQGMPPLQIKLEKVQ